MDIGEFEPHPPKIPPTVRNAAHRYRRSPPAFRPPNDLLGLEFGSNAPRPSPPEPLHARRPARRLPPKNPPAKAKEITIRDAVRRFKTGNSQVAAHCKALMATGGPAFSHRVHGRPRLLRDVENAALEAYAHWLMESGCLAANDLIQEAANKLRSRCDSPARPVSNRWCRRWKDDNPWFRTTNFDPVVA